ncbi:putative Pyruvate dehydrogenase (acetyl-transferring) [Xenorhabdus nematophila ATCC 19061]|uniref:3-methyl-2-oxobutanoate dehydrogenase (2-methylpropanoyl-transferring) n=1 Tax=Xenorhabdus nematophila (strain ATCC 19061 / DSM 3370 / CCUG 14189 / LMG 1036 / NCIMB 9965 / AN6) TaxID=406817 RepID=D3VCV2_XENNA|nr:alpha-ketoacid dehydrogenase subunit alpha/beta [Xenorhabdus nematophila]CBJ89818.1 putative Pyruvate dehydrogenase (acetyl-transferring) [Xenorhabdus nematophila ATCC 19061]CEK22703.1 putative Pyruvate dehydrogenase (acetyl-transferring) [Xenorhabdus nematophila AN6/1]
MDTVVEHDVLSISPSSQAYSLDWMALLRTMQLSREIDKRSALFTRQGRAWFHMSAAGHEGLAVLAQLLTPSDLIFPHYRDRALVLARGMSTEAMARELMAKADSHSGGRNMTNHFCDHANGIFSIASPTASQCLPATGAAWAAKLEKQPRLIVCGIGDASTRQGEFYEAVCFAVEKQLPIVFVVSDNRWGISTATQETTPFNLKIFSDELIRHADARQPDTLFEIAQSVFDKARNQHIPAVLVCRTDRLDSHSSSDDQKKYRSPEELASMQDPIAYWVEKMQAHNYLNQDDCQKQQQEIIEEVAGIFERVYQEADPASESITTYLYPQPREERHFAPLKSETTMVSALNQALLEALENEPNTLIFGEDIADPKGGVFGFTRGLSERYAERVVNSPLAEATLLGVATGLAAQGWCPIIELQFIDFIGPGFSQLQSQLATLSWRTLGAWRCPVVIYAPYGAYLPGGGIWHSQSQEGLLAHIPGINIAVPTTPADTVALFRTALNQENPSVILIPKHLMRKKHPVCPVPHVPYGIAKLLCTGEDITLVSWGNGIPLAEKAVEMATEQGISIDLIELRSVVPWDTELVTTSLRKTGRLIVVQEDNRTASFGASLIADLVHGDNTFFSLLAPPKLVAREDVPVPFHPSLESAVLPGVEDIFYVIQNVMK